MLIVDDDEVSCRVTALLFQARLTRAGPELFDRARHEGFDLAFSKPLEIDDMERHVRRTTRMHELEL